MLGVHHQTQDNPRTAKPLVSNSNFFRMRDECHDAAQHQSSRVPHMFNNYLDLSSMKREKATEFIQDSINPEPTAKNHGPLVSQNRKSKSTLERSVQHVFTHDRVRCTAPPRRPQRPSRGRCPRLTNLPRPARWRGPAGHSLPPAADSSARNSGT